MLETINVVIRNLLAAIFTNFKTTVADETRYPRDKGMVIGDKEKIFNQFRRICQDTA
jgi:hypothetical protein